MGTKHHYTCPACRYTAEVSGGEDYGFIARTQTVACRECRQLSDVLVGTRDDLQQGKRRRAAVPPGVLLAVPEETAAYIPRTRRPVCPNDAHHHVEPWCSPGPCPRCDTPMTDEGESMCWD